MPMVTSQLVDSLERARFELIPMKGVEQQIEHLPPSAVVTVTASPTKGLGPTLALARQLSDDGHRVVPHVSARLVESAAHAHEIVEELSELGVIELFVPAGDIESPLGPYEGAADFLELLATFEHPFVHIGITGYPERHAFIPDKTTIDAMARKVPFATYIVSQICYDPSTIRTWVNAVRARGVQLPIFLGVPGVMDRSRLLRVSMRVGLGDSIRYLRKQHEVASKLLAGYEPNELLETLEDLIGHPSAQVAGWHLFTFNEVEQTERWRQQLLNQLREQAG